ncbi:hypothetical protein SEA_Phreeze_45 [Mycobacterium phage Phreeze]|uniref:Uncharacterized protein n=1 Tax=Mycobacterium phage Konstantine TaxID=563121 RepID=B5U520_9CAUD|nr:gp50 [Mycobacterium phage Konstantine]ACI12466.1 hypothetical protein KONSTANTINE_50 [Mycobacterium phage Konstantine]QDH84909.1 hypothetical protein SEA_Phreeze_45 [Mycobacterium phage Phreeze]QLF83931.1 hypothetical protein SEA_BECKERTON_46 [Mycobacterium phage Beckerton]
MKDPEFTQKQVGDFVQHRMDDNFGRVTEVSPGGWRISVRWDHNDEVWTHPNSDLILIKRAS